MINKYKEFYESVIQYGINPTQDYPCKKCDGPVSAGMVCCWCGDEGPEPAERWYSWSGKPKELQVQEGVG